MSGFPLRWPEGFIPEEHGWVRVAGDAMGVTWLRWDIPFLFPAAISYIEHHATSGTVLGWFLPPAGTCPEQMTLAEIHAEMLNRGDGVPVAQERESRAGRDV